MKIEVPTTQEQLVHYLLHNLQLGTYDKRFLTNIHGQIYYEKKPLTTNQAALLHKIVMRYQRQIAKREMNSHDLIKLPWNLQPTESLLQYTQAYVSIDDDGIIVVHSPYKTAFVKEIRNADIAVWHKETKEWSIPYCEENLKRVVDIVVKHYDNVVLCDTTSNILETAHTYPENCYWNPTLVNCNGNLMIVASNEYLNNAITELNNDLATIVKIMSYGVELGDNVIDPNHEYYNLIKHQECQIDISDIDRAISFLKEIKCEKIFVGDIFLGGQNLYSEFMAKLTQSEIPYVLFKYSKPTDFENCNYALVKNVLISAHVTDDIIKKSMKIIGITSKIGRAHV